MHLVHTGRKRPFWPVGIAVGRRRATGVLRVLEAVRACHLEKTCRIYQASTSELYGKVEEVPQNENTPFHPYSPYAVAKLYGFWIVKEYREVYDMFCCSCILFNHDSERRGETFVTRKITLATARISQGLQDCLYLGNMDSLRDWSYARDYVECMWLILQNDRPEDFVIATGVQHSVREFTQLAFRYAGIELKFEGKGIDEKGIVVSGPEKLICKTVVAVSEVFTDRLTLSTSGVTPPRPRPVWAGILPRPASNSLSSSWWSTTLPR